MVLFVNCYVMLHFLFFFSFHNYVSWLYNNLSLGKSCQLCLPSVHFVGCFILYFIVFVCLSLWCWGLDVDLIVSVSKFSSELSNYWCKVPCGACKSLPMYHSDYFIHLGITEAISLRPVLGTKLQCCHINTKKGNHKKSIQLSNTFRPRHQREREGRT